MTTTTHYLLGLLIIALTPVIALITLVLASDIGAPSIPRVQRLRREWTPAEREARRKNEASTGSHPHG